ncbi:hypothetical protein MBLNU457_g2411t2 [Dothideomycetes sp. NU457]
MAPFRPSARSNRSGRLQADNDVFEGLPVRQWRRTEGTFGLPPPAEIEQDNDCPFPELPMPRETSLLLPHTQQLLREARKPRFAKRKTERHEDDKGDDEDEAETEVSKGWQTKKWGQVPRQLEVPEREYLAKRRKGLPSLAATEPTPAVPQVPTRTAKVRKLDDAGNSTIYEVIAPVGQTIEGEVLDEDVSMTEAPTLAPGTVVEGIGIANAEGQVIAHDLLQQTPLKTRRKPPPPKRKGGPGRGRKKVMFQSTTAPAEGTTTNGAVNGAAAPADGTTAAPLASQEGQGTEEQTVEGDDDEGEDGEDGDEGEGEGEGDDDEDREDGEISDGEKLPAISSALPSAPTSAPDSDAVSSAIPAVTAQIDSAAPSDLPMPDAEMIPVGETSNEPLPPTEVAAPQPLAPTTLLPPPVDRAPSSSPDLPLAQGSISRTGSLTEATVPELPVEEVQTTIPAAEPLAADPATEQIPEEQPVAEPEASAEVQPATAVEAEQVADTPPAQEESLLDRFERGLDEA